MRVGLWAWSFNDDTWGRVTETDTDHMVIFNELSGAQMFVSNSDRNQYLYFIDLDDLLAHSDRLEKAKGKNND